MAKSSKIIIGVAVIIFLLLSARYIMIFSEYNNIFYNKESNNLNGEIKFVSNRIDKKDKLEELIKEFEKENPKVNVKLELIGDAEEILARKASVGELSDITLVPSNISEEQYDKYFLPIDDLGFNDDNIYNYYLGVGRDKKLYTLTTSLSYVGVIYNKSIFKRCNIDKIPTTNDEFFEDCAKIKKEGIVPIALNYKQPWGMNIWIETIPSLYDINFEEKIIDGEYGILDDNSELYRAINFPKLIYEKGFCQENINEYDWSECKEDIVNNKMAMIVWNSDFINQLSDLGMDKENIGIFPFPETSQINITGDYKLAISKNTKKPNESKAFFKFLFDDNKYADAVNIMPTLKSSENSKKFLEDIKKFDCKLNFIGDISQNSTSDEEEKHYKYLKLRTDLMLNHEFIQKYILSEDPKEFLKQYKDKEMNLKSTG